MKGYVLLFALFLSSCAVAELAAEDERESGRGERPGMLRTKSGGAGTDSLAVLSTLQSDTELMLLNQIYYKDGRLVLALCREEAVDLGVPEDLYDRYAAEINRANEALTDRAPN